MSRRSRFSSAEKAELWRRSRAQQTLVQIGAGGFAPPERRRSVRHLSLVEREEISRALAGGVSLQQIARCLGRATSTVSREVRRGGGRTAYRAAEADAAAWNTGRRPKTCKLACHRALQLAVSRKLCLKWSPEQIDRAADATAPLAHLGPRQRDVPPPQLQPGHRHQGVLL